MNAWHFPRRTAPRNLLPGRATASAVCRARDRALDDYYRSLGIVVEIGAVTSRTIARVAQLTQKTNQFNLTTRRYSEQEIAVKAADARWRVDALTASDRFGDYGLVGVAITNRSGDVCEIDSFLLSCRIIGRSIETALLSYVAREAASGGMRTLRGWYLPTRKNAPVQRFLLRSTVSR